MVNDLDCGLINFWKVLQGQLSFLEFQRQVQAIPFSEFHWQEASKIDQDGKTNDITRAVAFFVQCRQSLAGRRKAFAPLSRNRVRRGMNEQVSAWLSAVEGLQQVHERLKRVVVLNRPAVEVIQENDTKYAVQYLDPPYLHETRASTDEYGRYEMSYHQHQHLLNTIKKCKCKILISGYHSKLYDTELADWNAVEFDLPNNASHSETKDREVEVIWKNF